MFNVLSDVLTNFFLEGVGTLDLLLTLFILRNADEQCLLSALVVDLKH